jgi:hypothetical protein
VLPEVLNAISFSPRSSSSRITVRPSARNAFAGTTRTYSSLASVSTSKIARAHRQVDECQLELPVIERGDGLLVSGSIRQDDSGRPGAPRQLPQHAAS